jgi:transcription antitermination factor NusG
MTSTGESSILPWYALKVRTKAEEKLQQALINKGFETFLPTSIDVRRYSDRLKKVRIALFPGYLFCRLDHEHPLPLISTPGVESIVGRGGLPEPIPDQEISAIQSVLQSDKIAVPWPYLKAGDKVRVQFGSLAGVEGTLIKTKGLDRLVLSIHLLQRSISFEIERDWVRPI